MARYKIKFDNKDFERLERKLGEGKARQLRKAIKDDLEHGIRDMAEQAAENSPKETTALMHSILSSVKQENQMKWVFGSHLPYAQRQEYEHKKKKYYFQRAVNAEKNNVKGKIKYTIKRLLK